MNHLGTMYATKRRRRNSKSIRNQPKEGQTKTNPSKRHRERLNAELDLLASLLPFDQAVLSKLDKLSILRLSVSYLRTKSYFQCILNKEKEVFALNNTLNNSNSNCNILNKSNNHLAHLNHQLNNLQTNQHSIQNFQNNGQNFHQQLSSHLNHLNHNIQIKNNKEFMESFMEGDLILQALNGFLFILTCDGEVFYTSHTVETHLGFHQSDICHQSVYELVHSEDREELQRHLMWNSALPNDKNNITLNEVLQPDNWHYLERNFTVRFRCLKDNTSGFLRLDIRGRIKVLHGQNLKSTDDNNYNTSTPLALFAVCTPFGPPSLLEMPSKENLFKSKHRLDFSWIQLDSKGKQILGYNETDLLNRGGYDLVHYDDLEYVASAHQELLKTGASGLIAYRLSSKNLESWQWLQTSARLVYKNSKPDFILCTHRPLMEEEGRDLYGKRTMDFKVTYLDGGLGAMNAADRSFITDRNVTSEKNIEERSIKSNSVTSFNNSTLFPTKPTKSRKTKQEKNATNAISNSNVILNHNVCTSNTPSVTATVFTGHNTGFEHALNYTNNNTPDNCTNATNRYNTSLTDYYGNAAANHHQNAAAAYYGSSSYPNYNAQTNVTIINNNYNLNVTQNSYLGSVGLPNSATSSALANENSSSSSLSSNSSFSPSSTVAKKKFLSNSNEDYDQFNHLINGHHASHAFQSNNSTQHTLQHVPHQSHAQHTHPQLNHLNHPLNQNTMILNNGNNNSLNTSNSFCENSNNSANTSSLSNNFGISNNSFVYSPRQQSTQLQTPAEQILATNSNNSSINIPQHAHLQSQLVNLSHGSSPISNAGTPVHIQDQSNQPQLSPLSNTSNSNLLQTPNNNLEPMSIDSNITGQNISAAVVAAAVQQHHHQSLNQHLNSTNDSSLNNTNSLSNLSSPLSQNLTNSAISPQSNNSSNSNNGNLSVRGSSPTSVALAVASHYDPYNVSTHHPTPHHFLHYSRLSSYYHPDYHHLYNYFDPKFKNTGNLIGNNLIGNNNLFSNNNNLVTNNHPLMFSSLNKDDDMMEDVLPKKDIVTTMVANNPKAFQIYGSNNQSKVLKNDIMSEVVHTLDGDEGTNFNNKSIYSNNESLRLNFPYNNHSINSSNNSSSSSWNDSNTNTNSYNLINFPNSSSAFSNKRNLSIQSNTGTNNFFSKDAAAAAAVVAAANLSHSIGKFSNNNSNSTLSCKFREQSKIATPLPLQTMDNWQVDSICHWPHLSTIT